MPSPPSPPPSGRPGPGRPRKQPRPEGEGADARAGIVAAASRLFARRGIAATTMSEIAHESGLQQSSLYYWFGSKPEILEVIITDMNRAPLEFAERLVDDPAPAAVRLYRLIRFDAATLCTLAFDINEVHRLAGEDETAFARYWAERQRLNDAVESIVAAGVRDGAFLPVDARLSALTLLANDEAAQNWFRPIGGRRLAGRSEPAGGDYEPDEIATFLADLAVRGLLADVDALDEVRRAAEADG